MACVSCEAIGTHVWLFELFDSTIARFPETWSLSVAHSMYKSRCCTNVKDTGKSIVNCLLNIALIVPNPSFLVKIFLALHVRALPCVDRGIHCSVVANRALLLALCTIS